MGNRKQSVQTWSHVKEALANMNTKDLISLLKDLYSLSEKNQLFLHTRFGVTPDILRPYKKLIEACMYPDFEKNKPVQIAKAKKAISDYSKADCNPNNVTELMLYFVECGNRFTLDSGDIDEAFYDALNRMYKRVLDRVLTLPKDERNEFKKRLESIMNSSSGIGWGYHDTLCEDYYEAFPEEE